MNKLNWPKLYGGIELLNEIDLLIKFIINNNVAVSFLDITSVLNINVNYVSVECVNVNNMEDAYTPLLNKQYAEYFKTNLRRAKLRTI